MFANRFHVLYSSTTFVGSPGFLITAMSVRRCIGLFVHVLIRCPIILIFRWVVFAQGHCLLGYLVPTVVCYSIRLFALACSLLLAVPPLFTLG